MTDRKILLIGTAAAIGVLAGGALFMTIRQGDDQFAQCSSSSVAGGMDAFGTPFTLTRDDGQRVTDQDVFDKPTLLYFGYTFCPDVCPLDAARNAEAALETHLRHVRFGSYAPEPVPMFRIH